METNDIKIGSQLVLGTNTGEGNSVFESISLKIPCMAAGKTQPQPCTIASAVSLNLHSLSSQQQTLCMS
jgi:hypothetical protein